MLKFLITILCLFFIIRFIGRFFVASTFSNLNRRMQEQMKQQQPFSNPQSPEGHISVNSGKKKNSQEHDGEYVDYEEVK